MGKTIEQGSVTNAGLISIIGALTIFFSWTVTNTLGQRYARLKQSVESGDNTFRLYTSLHELRDSLNSVAMETVRAREAAERISSNEADHSEIAVIRRQYYHTRMSAHQIKELMDFSSQTLDYSSSVERATEASRKIETLHSEIYKVYAKVRDLDRAAEDANGTTSPPLSTLRQAIDAYVAYVMNDAIPQVPKLYEAVVGLSNNRREEGRRELAHAKRNATIAANLALVLYMLGSLLALGGQYIDKVYKKSVHTEANVPRQRQQEESSAR